MGPVCIRPEADIRAATQAAVEEHRARILELLPEAEIEHVGSTSIPGALTKGDVAVTGSPDDALFGPFRDAMIRDPALLAEYNALKLRHDGADYERYTKVKGELIERVLGGLGRRPT
jgi:GrpB-like predicted nucleotidyltransferase (UPF0157 family)